MAKRTAKKPKDEAPQNGMARLMEERWQDVKAAMRAAVRRVLTKQGVKAKEFDRLMPLLMAQAEALYAEWPSAA